ncbi:hypothetical protein [Mycetocola zhadangensis]|uniref:Uncharacterized protein n=1 Tax=Mycetocola zhadangensis TaxID=1164595 RepID=A0A3L7J4X0_9MICO|nr:hypothetical protein [Mycetocola zhadangensis]RLQ84511.1 hypothetical protein D9V28_10060 [Mycetocola zhadangensis]GGE92341.1 hypothetical protein GCM10011313_14070 [Mycetocola zhadangensis]
MSTAWAGNNWQLIDQDGPLTMVGVTFGIGLLNEQVESAGSLSIALAALTSELTRPVELGAGETYVPEGLVELHTDTVSIAIRGSLDAVSASWRRLPVLFTGSIVSDDVLPLRPEQPVWPADLLVRTGRNAATLARWQLTAPDAHERARRLLAELNPSTGHVPVVFFTTDESLVGLGFPVQHDEGTAPAATWADGAPRRGGRTSNDGAGNSRNRAGLLPRPEEDVLASALLPRSAAGAVAADLLRAQLNATPANGRAGLTVRAIVVGLGVEYCVFLLADRVPDERTRRSVLGEFSRMLGLVPDPWIEIALAESSRVLSPRLERERALFGLDPVLPATSADIKRAITGAVETLHLALDLSAAELDNGSRLNLGGVAEDLKPLENYWAPNFDGEQEFHTLATDDVPSTSLMVTPNSIVVPVRRTGSEAGPAVQWDGVDTSRLLARVEDPVGTVTLIDEAMRNVSIAPNQFAHPDRVMRAVEEHLTGVARLSFLGEVQLPTAPPPAPREGRSRRRRVAPADRRRRAGVWAGLAVALGAVVAVNVVPTIFDTTVTEELTFGDTVRLANETEITASQFDVFFPRAEQPDYIVTAIVNFCAGSDSDMRDLPPEVQRTVSPDDFALVNEDGTEGRLLESDDQLSEGTLAAGECTTGEVVFISSTVFTPRIVYTNSAGDEVTWLE